MGEKTAFERQVGKELHREMGAAPDFDPLAVAREAASAGTQREPLPITRWLPGGLHPRRERGLSMFAAMKFVAAAAIIGMFGGMLMADVMRAPEPVAIEAGAVEIPMGAAPVSGDLRVGAASGVTTEIGTDRISYRGARMPVALDTDDPRLSGSGLFLENSDLLIGALGQQVLVGQARIVNKTGSWVGPYTGVYDDAWRNVLHLRGHGGYDGLSALVFLSDTRSGGVYEVSGLVFPGELPPDPGPAAVSPGFDPEAARPVAVTADTLGRVRGQMLDVGTADPGTSDESFADRLRTLGWWIHMSLDADDPRFDGTWSEVFNEDRFFDAVGNAVRVGSVRIDNADGSWQGSSWMLDAPGVHFAKLDGAGAYEGLTALLFQHSHPENYKMVVHGVVMEGPLPEHPEAFALD